MKASRSATRFFVGAVLAVVGAVVGCGSDAGLVGGTCRAPYVECNLTCIDVSSDPLNCGGCATACAAGVACVGGVCGGTGSPVMASEAGVTNEAGATSEGGSDSSLENDATQPEGGHLEIDGAVVEGGTRDGGSDGDTSLDGGQPDASTLDASAPDADLPDADLPDTQTADACAPPYVTNDHCGSCFTACSAPNDTCRAQPDSSYACVPFCDAPALNCSGTCLDVSSDGDNCGACGRVCASNICIAGKCQGEASGDIVYIGHDYMTTPVQTSQARLLENAVFLSPKTPVRVLAYERYASPTAAARIKAIFADATSRTGRAIQVTSTVSDDDVANATILNYEAVVVLDQQSAPSGTLASLGSTWSGPLAAYTHIGGVLVALDGAAATSTGEMPQFISATGLLSVTTHAAAAASEQFALIAPADGVGVGVVTPYAMRANSSHFTSEPNNGTVSWVVRHTASGEPNVVHKIAP